MSLALLLSNVFMIIVFYGPIPFVLSLYYLFRIPDFCGAISKFRVPQTQSFMISATLPYLWN